MLRDEIAQRGEAQQMPGPLRVGVEWRFYPTARYYADRLPAGGVRVEPIVLPGDGLRLDFAYGPPPVLPRSGRVIAEHQTSGAKLRHYRAASSHVEQSQAHEAHTKGAT